jgi:uncharacterized membrane protein
MAFGVEHAIFGDFITGRAPAWPVTVPGQLAWAYLSGAILVAAGAAILGGKVPRVAAVLSGTMILVWALFRHLPIVAANLDWGLELTQAGKALALWGGTFAVAGSLPQARGALVGTFATLLNPSMPFLLLGRWCLGVFMIICGIEHFVLVEFVHTLVPSWIPGPFFWTYFTGIALIAGGAGLFLRQTLRLAALLSGIMIFTWVIVLHIPRAVTSAGDGTEWISVVEALAMSGIAFVLAGSTMAGRLNDAP